VLQDAATHIDLASASLWAAVPAYASQVPSPKAALALVERTCEMLGCPASTARLVAEAGEYDARVSAFVGDDDDLIGYVSRLESLADSGELDDDDEDDEDDEDVVQPAEVVDDAGLDSEALMAEVERFLRDQGNSA
jgi:hypothetical protein